MYTGLIAFYGTSDMHKTHSFYNEVLGLPLALEQTTCRLYAVPGGGHVGFCEHLPVTHAHKSPLITLVTNDVDAIYERILAAGIKPEVEPQENTEFKLYHFFVKDPVGYTVEIQQFLDDNWDASKQ